MVRILLFIYNMYQPGVLSHPFSNACMRREAKSREKHDSCIKNNGSTGLRYLGHLQVILLQLHRYHACESCGYPCVSIYMWAEGSMKLTSEGSVKDWNSGLTKTGLTWKTEKVVWRRLVWRERLEKWFDKDWFDMKDWKSGLTKTGLTWKTGKDDSRIIIIIFTFTWGRDSEAEKMAFIPSVNPARICITLELFRQWEMSSFAYSCPGIIPENPGTVYCTTV